MVFRDLSITNELQTRSAHAICVTTLLCSRLEIELTLLRHTANMQWHAAKTVAPKRYRTTTVVVLPPQKSASNGRNIEIRQTKQCRAMAPSAEINPRIIAGASKAMVKVTDGSAAVVAELPRECSTSADSARDLVYTLHGAPCV